MKALTHACEFLPSKEQIGQSQVSQATCSNFHQNELTWLTPISPQLELGVLTSEHNMLDKVDLLGCTEWVPEDQQKARKILREYMDVFPKDDLDWGRPQL